MTAACRSWHGPLLICCCRSGRLPRSPLWAVSVPKQHQTTLLARQQKRRCGKEQNQWHHQSQVASSWLNTWHESMQEARWDTRKKDIKGLQQWLLKWESGRLFVLWRWRSCSAFAGNNGAAVTSWPAICCGLSVSLTPDDVQSLIFLNTASALRPVKSDGCYCSDMWQYNSVACVWR